MAEGKKEKLFEVKELTRPQCQRILDDLYRTNDNGFRSNFGQICLYGDGGAGSCGRVYRSRATSEKYPEDIAVKFVDTVYATRKLYRKLYYADDWPIDCKKVQDTINNFNFEGSREASINKKLSDNGCPVMQIYGTFTFNCEKLLGCSYERYIYIFIMPYLPDTLEKMIEGIDEQCVDIDRALSYMRELAYEIELLHAQNIIHRDIKPNNIFIKKSHVVLGDFGYAKQLEEIDCKDKNDYETDYDTFAINSEAIPYRDFVFLDEYGHEKHEITSTKITDIFALGMIFLYLITAKTQAYKCIEKETEHVSTNPKNEYLIDVRKKIQLAYSSLQKGEQYAALPTFLIPDSEQNVKDLVSTALRYPVGKSYKNATEFREALDAEIERRHHERLKIANDKVAVLESKLLSTDAALESAKQTLLENAELVKKVAALESKIDDANHTLIESENQKASITEKCKKQVELLKKQLDDAQKETHELQAENENLKNGTSTSNEDLNKIAELEESIRKAKEESDTDKKEIKHLYNVRAELDRDINTLKSENEKLKASAHIIRTVFITLISFTITLAVAMFALSWYMYPNPFSNTDFIGLTTDEAESQIETAGWSVTTENIYDGQHEFGTVSSQKINRFKKSVVLGISQGLQEEAVNGDNASIKTNEEKIVMTAGEKYQLLVSVCTTEDYDYHLYFEQSLNVDVEWGEWLNGSTTLLTFTATEQNEGYIRVSVVNDDTDEVAAYTDVYVAIQ